MHLRMFYQYASTKYQYEYLASGRILYSLPGQSAFPVRLGSEIFQRCLATFKLNGNQESYSLYDPCCGGAYLLTSLGFLHSDQINCIYASDINHEALSLAEKNLHLLTIQGLNTRILQLKSLVETYHKESHVNAWQEATELLQKRTKINSPAIHIFQADATSLQIPFQLVNPIDIVFSDLPYGKLVHWQTRQEDPMKTFFDEMSKILKSSHSVLAISVADKLKISTPHFSLIEKFKVGHRLIYIFQKK